MDNVSDALKIAGGMIITVLILGVIAFTYKSTSGIPDTKEATLSTEETATFNAEYEAYEKKVMLGTDVISVINKALDNNKKYNFQDTQEREYFVNVKFKLKTPVDKVVYEYSTDENGKRVGKKLESESNTIFGKTGIYIFLYDQSSGYMNSQLQDFMKIGTTYSNSSNKETIEEKQADGKVKVTYTGYTDFKRKSFTCRRIEYNKNNGRVNMLVFDEIKQDSTTY